MTLPIKRLTAAGPALLVTALLASAAHAEGDAANGKKLFFGSAQCRVCHSEKPDVKRVGPSLFGVVGRKCGTAAKQNFSSNYKAACGKTQFVWDEQRLDGYLADPTGYISAITGERRRSPMPKKTENPQHRADIIAYLKTLK